MNKLIIVICLIALFGCQTKVNNANQTASDIKVADQPDIQVAPNGNVKEFDVEAFQFGFEPNEIHVNLGDKVIIHLSSRDVSHSFTIPAFHVNLPVNPGAHTSISFIADQKGTFKWFCSIPCGSGHKSMEGKLVVE